MKNNTLSVAEVNAAPEVLAQIIALHSEITEAARTSLDKAITLGDLLAQEKERLGHGNWLPWLKANVPFTDRTARNYIRCFENRERIKLESVSDLTVAYRLLAPPTEQDRDLGPLEKLHKPTPSFIPAKGEWSSGTAPAALGNHWSIVVMPSAQIGFFFVNVFLCETPVEKIGGSLEGSVKAHRSDSVERVVELITGVAAGEIEWTSDQTDERWTYNEELFSSHQDYIDRAILGKKKVGSL